jgi:hypothetical protein
MFHSERIESYFGLALPLTSGLSEETLYNFYNHFVSVFGSEEAKTSLNKGEQVLLGLRLEFGVNTRLNRGRGLYRDRLALLWNDPPASKQDSEVKHAYEFKFNTEPSAQYEPPRRAKDGKPIPWTDPSNNLPVQFKKADAMDVDKLPDNLEEMGRLEAGRTYNYRGWETYTQTNKKTGKKEVREGWDSFPSKVRAKAQWSLVPVGPQSAERDILHTGDSFGAAWNPCGPAKACNEVRTHTGYFGMRVHMGGVGNTWSAGCQTLPPKEHARLFGLLKHTQKMFYYVLVSWKGYSTWPFGKPQG